MKDDKPDTTITVEPATGCGGGYYATINNWGGSIPKECPRIYSNCPTHAAGYVVSWMLANKLPIGRLKVNLPGTKSPEEETNEILKALKGATEEIREERIGRQMKTLEAGQKLTEAADKLEICSDRLRLARKPRITPIAKHDLLNTILKDILKLAQNLYDLELYHRPPKPESTATDCTSTAKVGLDEECP